VSESALLEVRDHGYVSRGGRKLAHALDVFDLSVRGRVFLDAGASTGGFTDCLLRRGASTVHAVDSGHNQLAYRLRKDARVIVREDTPIQTVTVLEPVPEVAVADISFRSLRGIAPHILSLTTSRSGVFLLKPQFEWLEPPPAFDGVIRDSTTIARVISQVIEALRLENVEIRRAVESPIRGREGNREFLAVLTLGRPGPTPGEAGEIAERLVSGGSWPSAIKGATQAANE
jgi:23S rRNA (cytidine1920-2'-O)/16S rRNA (cytidine1409-2'-O)-methyltransferase